MDTAHIIFCYRSSEGHCRHCGDRYKFKPPHINKKLGATHRCFYSLTCRL